MKAWLIKLCCNQNQHNLPKGPHHGLHFRMEPPTDVQISRREKASGKRIRYHIIYLQVSTTTNIQNYNSYFFILFLLLLLLWESLKSDNWRGPFGAPLITGLWEWKDSVGPDIKFGINPMPLTAWSITHKFNNFILKKITLNSMVQSIRWMQISMFDDY